MYFVYLLQSEKDNSIYLGYTENLKRRLKEHNSGGSNFTKTKKPWTLIYCECFRIKQDAITREKKLKLHGKGLSELKKRLEFSLKNRK